MNKHELSQIANDYKFQAKKFDDAISSSFSGFVSINIRQIPLRSGTHVTIDALQAKIYALATCTDLLARDEVNLSLVPDRWLEEFGKKVKEVGDYALGLVNSPLVDLNVDVNQTNITEALQKSTFFSYLLSVLDRVDAALTDFFRYFPVLLDASVQNLSAFSDYFGSEYQQIKNLKDSSHELLRQTEIWVADIDQRTRDVFGNVTNSGLASVFYKNSKWKNIWAICAFVFALAVLIAMVAFPYFLHFKGKELSKVGWDGIYISLAFVLPLSVLLSIVLKTMRRLEKIGSHYEHKGVISEASMNFRELYSGNDKEKHKDELITMTIREILKDPTDNGKGQLIDDVTLIGVLSNFAKSFKGRLAG